MAWDVTKFNVTAADAFSRGLIGAISAPASMEEAAGRACSFVRDALHDDAGNQAAVLVRAYKTHDYGRLPADIQRAAKRAYGKMAFSPPEPDLKCLVLLASVGVEPAWNDRRTSKNHQAIPLPSRDIVENAPMIAQLIRELGLDLGEVIQPSQGLVRETAGKSYGVFHVSQALGSPYIPAQDFVRNYGVQSVVGFGGALASGELVALIAFSRVPISVDVADRFRAVALEMNDSFARFGRDATFSTEPAPTPA